MVSKRGRRISSRKDSLHVVIGHFPASSLKQGSGSSGFRAWPSPEHVAQKGAEWLNGDNFQGQQFIDTNGCSQASVALDVRDSDYSAIHLSTQVAGSVSPQIHLDSRPVCLENRHVDESADCLVSATIISSRQAGVMVEPYSPLPHETDLAAPRSHAEASPQDCNSARQVRDCNKGGQSSSTTSLTPKETDTTFSSFCDLARSSWYTSWLSLVSKTSTDFMLAIEVKHLVDSADGSPAPGSVSRGGSRGRGRPQASAAPEGSRPLWLPARPILRKAQSLPCRLKEVNFDDGATTKHPVTPYAEVYGEHPHGFDFDASGNLIPRDAYEIKLEERRQLGKEKTRRKFRLGCRLVEEARQRQMLIPPQAIQALHCAAACGHTEAGQLLQMIYYSWHCQAQGQCFEGAGSA